MNIPLSVPFLKPDIADNLRACVESGWVSTGGPFIPAFEAAFAEYVGAREAVGCQSGTAGLHTALRVLGVGPGDEVIVPTLTFIAAVNPVVYVNAAPVFADCDESLCLDPVKLADFCENACTREARGLVNRRTGRRVAAVVVVHVFGNLADMAAVTAVARRYGLKVVEDATEALGSRFTQGRLRGKHAGTVGDVGVFSFNANKIITTGGGGMLVAKRLSHTKQARYLTTTAKDDDLYFVHGDVGYNYRMLNIQAAFGVSQIADIEAFVAAKTAHYRDYEARLATPGFEGARLLPFRDGTRPNRWFYTLEIDEAAFGMSRDALLSALIARGILCRPVWRLCHRQKPYKKAQRFRISRALRCEKTLLNLPCSVGLRPEDVARVCEAIREIRTRGV